MTQALLPRDRAKRIEQMVNAEKPRLGRVHVDYDLRDEVFVVTIIDDEGCVCVYDINEDWSDAYCVTEILSRMEEEKTE